MRKNYICKRCNSEFKDSRSDQLFCSQECRYAWHHDKIKPELEVMREVTKALYKNRKVLKELSLNDHAYPLSFLLGRGFNFNYFTGIKTIDGFSKATVVVYEYQLEIDILNKTGIVSWCEQPIQEETYDQEELSERLKLNLKIEHLEKNK